MLLRFLVDLNAFRSCDCWRVVLHGIEVTNSVRVSYLNSEGLPRLFSFQAVEFLYPTFTAKIVLTVPLPLQLHKFCWLLQQQNVLFTNNVLDILTFSSLVILNKVETKLSNVFELCLEVLSKVKVEEKIILS